MKHEKCVKKKKRFNSLCRRNYYYSSYKNDKFIYSDFIRNVEV